MRIWALVAAIAALGAGCGLGGHSRGPDPLAMEEAPSDGSALLHVDNRNWQDIEVFAVRRGARMRLGTVSGMASGDFKLPNIASSGAGEYRLLVAPVGDLRSYFATNTILLGAGQTLDLRVENNLNLTTYSIY